MISKFINSKKIKPNLRTIIFWIMVGIAAGVTYDAEWFIQRVILFNGKLAKDIENGHPDLIGITSVSDYFDKLEQAFKLSSDSTLNTLPIINYYDNNIKLAFSTEGLIFSVGALLASFISGPILVGFSMKKKNYIIFTLPLMLIFAITLTSIAPLLSSSLLLWTVFTPIFGIGYGYRTILDPWGTSDAKRNGVRISWVRSFYELGAGIISLTLTLLLFSGNYYKKELSYATALPFYFAAAGLVLLAIFLIFFMPNKELFDLPSNKKEIAASKVKWTEIAKSKQFIIGIIIFTLLIGTVAAFNSVWTNTIENTTSNLKNPNGVQYIGYMKMFVIAPKLLLAYFIYHIFNKVSFKKLLTFTAIFSAFSWILIGSLVYIIRTNNMILVSMIGGVAAATTGTFSVMLGYEWIGKISTKNTRGALFVIFNSVAYGVGAIVFVQINGFLSKTEIFGFEGLIPWFAMGIAALLSLVLIIPFFKEPKEIEHESIENAV